MSQAQTKLGDFTSQKSMLVNYVDNLLEWLDHKHQMLSSMMRNPKSEHLKKCRVNTLIWLCPRHRL